MNFRIENDLFDIVKRIKEIDDGYFVEYNSQKDCYEIHNSKQLNTYCLSIPFDSFDGRVINVVLSSLVRNIDTIINEIDKNNASIENNSNIIVKDQADYMVREIYDFCSNSSKEFNDNCFQVGWK